MRDSTWQERVALGERLARELDAGALAPGELDPRLLALLADVADTAVTFRTAVALLRRGDPLGLAHVLHALAAADETGDETTGDWLGDAFVQVLSDDPGLYGRVVQPLLEAASVGEDERQASAAGEILVMVGPRPG